VINNNNIKIICLFTFLISCKTDFIKNQAYEKIPFFLCIGQSNMAGRAIMTNNDTLVIDNVFLFNENQKWEPAKNPLNRFSTVRKKIGMQQIGPSWSFAKEIVKKEKKIGLVVNARGGTSIKEWKKGGLLYNEAVIRVLQAQKKGNLKGILWLQGSADRKEWFEYAQRFKLFVQNLRNDLNSSQVPIFVSEIGNWKNTSDSINYVISNLNNHVPNLVAIEVSDLPHLGDTIHFNRDSQIEIGKRFAKKYFEFINN
tara:strand:- start:2644 stop:3408 length:765 start_codon:yes stop_codon:yes gene_type:complete